MLSSPYGNVLINIKLFLLVNVFKHTPPPSQGVSVPKYKILPKPEVSHKKSENRGFRFRYRFQTLLMGTNHTSGQFCPP